MNRPPVPHRLATTLLALVLPGVVVGGATVLALAWRDRLPDPVASHWGSAGADGFSSLSELLPVLPITGLGIAALLWAVGFFFGNAAFTRRFIAAAAVWSATFVSGLVVAMLAVQLDLTDATDARLVGWPIAIALIGSLVLGALAAWLTPGDAPRPASAPIPDGAPHLPLPDAEQATWVRRIDNVHPGAVAAVVLAFAAFLAVVTDLWWLGVVLVATLAPLLIGVTSWTVTVDRHGLTARSRLPRPRLVVPLEEVERADVATVNPIKDFCGWGMRIGLDGRVGVVLRRGEAIEVRRTGGRVVVVTVDDAATGAALLNTLAARARARLAV